MTTNQDALREALANRIRAAIAEVRRKSYPLSDLIPMMQEAAEALSQPMPEAAQGWKDGNTAKLVNDLRDVAVQFRDAEQLRERIAYIIRPLADRLSASPAAPQQQDQDIEQLIQERDHRDEIIDRLCDAVLGADRPEWSSAYGFDDAVADVEDRITQLHQPSVDRAWARFEQASAQPQAQGEPPPAWWKCDTHGPGHRYAWGCPECVREAREALAAKDAALDVALEALEFYAGGDHFTMHDPDAWDTVSGEPQNFYEDENNTATVEDGSIAQAAITKIKEARG